MAVRTALLLILLAVVPFFFTACTQTPERTRADVESTLNEMDLARDRTVQSIRDYRIRGWRYVDPYHVVLTSGRRENYLVSFMTPCFGLNSAFAIGFTSTAGGVTEFEDIVVEGPGRRAEVCPIREIVRLKDSER
jgi:hypothetical protein